MNWKIKRLPPLGVLCLLVLAIFAGARAASDQERSGLRQGAALEVLYRFSGATDDGEQGSLNRREATSVHCTNVDPISNIQVEVQVYQWDGMEVYTGTVNIPPNRSITYSTQNTTIYFDDVVLGGIPGTGAILQGNGQILTSSPNVICTAQILDPLNYPPAFASRLPLYYADGTPIDDRRVLYLPLIEKMEP